MNRYYSHPTATIDEGSSIGPGTRIWHYTHIMPGARIGENCVLGQSVFVGSDVIIGNRVKVQFEESGEVGTPSLNFYIYSSFSETSEFLMTSQAKPMKPSVTSVNP